MAAPPFLIFLLLWFAAVNSFSYLLMLLDKRAAERGAWRVSEATLQKFFFFGGAIGGKVAQRKLRHKTRKQPFAGLLNFYLLINLVGYSALCFPKGLDAVLSVLAEIGLIAT